MVGRTPEYMGKKIRPMEMKYAARYFLALPADPDRRRTVDRDEDAAGIDSRPGTARPGRDHVRLHLDGERQRLRLRRADHQHDWYNTAGGIVMLLGRFAPEIFALGLAGSWPGSNRCRQAPALENGKPLFVGCSSA